MNKILVLLSLSALALPAFAEPLPVRSEATTARGVLLPVLGRPHGASNIRGQIDLTNEFVLSQVGNETLTVDVETVALRFSETVDLENDWFAGMEITLLDVGGGFMDSLIEDWHEFFGLPNAGRERRPQDQYLIQYSRDGNTVYEQRKSDAGLGDTQFWLGKRLSDNWAWISAIKLPTGEDRTLLGNGELGYGSWFDGRFSGGAWSGFAALGASYNPKAEPFKELRREWVGFGGAGLGWRWTDWLQLKGQLNAHTPIYENTQIEALKRPGVQLTLGAGLNFGQTQIDLAFQEDIVTQSSADFSLHLGWRWTPDQR